MCSQFNALEIDGSLFQQANGAWRRGERLIDGNCGLSIPANSASRARHPDRLATCFIVERDRMIDRIRIIRHALLRSRCGSFEVRFADGRESRFFYWDDATSRRLRLKMLPSEQALEQAKAFARAEQDKET
jgi:hypothetical protein